jgi:hypothetical protein
MRRFPSHPGNGAFLCYKRPHCLVYRYIMRFKLGIAVFLLIVACSEKDQLTPPPRDTTRPTIISVAPLNASTGIPSDAGVAATFSEAMDPSSITTSTFSINGVAGVTTSTDEFASFTPNAQLTPNTEYAATITTGVKDIAGNALAEEYVWSFTTNTLPVANAGPDQDVDVATTVFLNGTASINPAGGVLTYSWTQVTGPTVSLISSTTATPRFTAPGDVSTLEFDLVVSNIDGSSVSDRVRVTALEDKTQKIFVSKIGNDSYAGTRAAPMATIQAAINRANAGGLGADLYVALGTYGLSGVTLQTGVSIYGGFNQTTWLRDLASRGTIISGGQNVSYGVAALVSINENSVVLDRLAIESKDALTAGYSSFGVMIVNSTQMVISNCAIIAGDGAQGSAGSNGAAAGTAADGGNGVSGGNCNVSCSCSGGNCSDGGSGGSGTDRGGGNGGDSGNNFGCAGYWGTGAAGGVGGAGGGTRGGGFDGTNGGGGGDGLDGPGGSAFGAVATSSPYTYLADYGRNGLDGYIGSGGGGGGGGGGNTFTCGGAGGGGGAGGRYGRLGTGGRGGGGSFGIWVVGGSVDITITATTITTSSGGNGGAAGNGSAGGAGGDGGVGGNGTDGGGKGGTGGDGGRGGRGGHGGGGGGGPSIGIVADATSDYRCTSCSFTIGSSGNGGTSSGNAGAKGQRAEQKRL